MVVEKYESAQAFLEAYEPLMLERESVSQLLLYNAYHSQSSNTNSELFGAVLDEDEVILLYCNIGPYNLVIYVNDIDMDKERVAMASVTLAKYLLENNITIRGLNARNDVCQSFMEYYRDGFPCTFLENLGMDIMEIRSVNEFKPVEGINRLARPDEVMTIADWMIQYNFETLASEMDYEVALNRVTSMINNNNIYVYENPEQKVVSMAAVTRKLVHGVAISYVYTPEEYRNKGYAPANIYYLSKYYLEAGCQFCSLFADRRNTILNRAYEKLGYCILEDHYDYKLIPVEENVS